MDQLAISIEPIVKQISPYMDKVQSLEKYSHIGKLENMIEKKKEIQKLARLNSLQYEKVQNLGKIPFSTQSSIPYFSRRKYWHPSCSLQRNHRQLITWLRRLGSAALRTWRSKPLNVLFKCPCCQILIVPFFKKSYHEISAWVQITTWNANTLLILRNRVFWITLKSAAGFRWERNLKLFK